MHFRGYPWLSSNFRKQCKIRVLSGPVFPCLSANYLHRAYRVFWRGVRMKGKITKKSIDALIAEAKAAGGVVTSSSPMAMRTFFISRSITHASLRTAFSAAFSRSFSDTALYWHLPQRSGRRKGRGGSKNKATAGWFPQQQRGLVTGAVNASTNIGAVLAAALVPLIVAQNGDHWQFVFMMTSAFSALWLIIWLKVYIKPEHNPRFRPIRTAVHSGRFSA